MFNGTTTKFEIISVEGDKTGWFHVTESQILQAEVIVGAITSITTMFNIDVGPNAILHVSKLLH